MPRYNSQLVQSYMEFAALITQSSTNATTLSLIKNDIGNYTLARSAQGVYTITFATGNIPAGTLFFISDNTTGLNKLKIARTSSSVITITTSAVTITMPPDGSIVLTNTDAILSSTPIYFRVPLV